MPPPKKPPAAPVGAKPLASIANIIATPAVVTGAKPRAKRPLPQAATPSVAKPAMVPDRSHGFAGSIPTAKVQGAGWSLVFEDDFSVDNLAAPSGPWATGFPWGQTMAGEREYYTRYDKNGFSPCSKGGANHQYVSSGGNHALRLIAKHEPGSYEVWTWDANGNMQTPCVHYDYTSGMLWSKQAFLYGRFEIRCTIPHSGLVLFPAFWLWNGSPYREIDIFEFEDPTTPHKWLTNIHIDRDLDFGFHHPSPDSPNSSLNDYPGITQLSDVDAFHVYAVDWRPSSVTWSIDGVAVRTEAGHAPPEDMHIIINLAMAPWRPAPDPSQLPAFMEIDYVRVYRNNDPEFLYHWGNSGAGKIASWNMNQGDRFLVGDFDGDGHDEVLAISAAGWIHLMRWDGAAWAYVWGNGGAYKIAAWNMKPDDRWVVGDFDGDGRDELLAFSSNGWCHLMRWDGANWQYVWGNNGSGKIAVWNIHPDDRTTAADFDGDGRCELMAIAAGAWSHLMRWNGSAFDYVWGNNGGGAIASWNIHAGDRFVAADFDGSGRAQLLAVAGDHWSHLMAWNGSAWTYVWGNNGNGKIGSWAINLNDRFFEGDFEGTGRRQLMSIGGNGWSHLTIWNGSDWIYRWGNDGANLIHRWSMKPSDRYVAGAFNGGKALVLASATNGWAHLLHFEPVP